MHSPRNSLYLKLTRLVATLLTLALGWIPLRLGYWTRNVLYPIILKEMGKSVRILTGVEFFNAHLISLGDEVLLDRDVRLRPLGSQTQIVIGNGVQIDRGTDIKVHYGVEGNITIGHNTIIGSYCFLSGQSIQIGEQCLIAPQVGIFANNHEFSDPLQYIRRQGHSFQGIVIEDDCWLGTGAKILDGVTIGRGSVIGAGAVVSKSLPPYSIAVGVPAKVVGSRGRKASFPDSGDREQSSPDARDADMSTADGRDKTVAVLNPALNDVESGNVLHPIHLKDLALSRQEHD